MPQVERRSYVRGNFSFKIKFKTMTSDEYEALLNSREPHFSHFQEEHGFTAVDKVENVDTSVDASLMNYMVKIDEKLDLILELLIKDNEPEDLFEQGIGVNISGSGMNIMVDEPVETGQIIHSKVYLSRMPIVFLDVFGEVVRSSEISECDKNVYSLGIRFLDLSVNDQEKIIAMVFKRQRGDLRKRKNGS
ncbi:MAG: PilZ domain-containing protein [Desulfobacterales bacterium]